MTAGANHSGGASRLSTQHLYEALKVISCCGPAGNWSIPAGCSARWALTAERFQFVSGMPKRRPPVRLYCTVCPPTRYAFVPMVIPPAVPRIIITKCLLASRPSYMYVYNPTWAKPRCSQPNSSAVETMSASSGSKGFCNVCSHANNEHNTYTCDVKGCRKKFKVCQTGSHVEWNVEEGVYVLCKACTLHPYSCHAHNICECVRLIWLDKRTSEVLGHGFVLAVPPLVCF